MGDLLTYWAGIAGIAMSAGVFVGGVAVLDWVRR